jgi:chromosome segregation ATPase
MMATTNTQDKVQQLETELQHIHYNNSLELQDLRSEVEDSAAQLEGLRVQLEEAHEALRLARQGIEERDFLIATHERSEEALADHAISLSGELQHAAKDIGALFATVAVAHRQHKVNSEAVRALRRAVDRRTAELRTCTAAVCRCLRTPY